MIVCLLICLVSQAAAQQPGITFQQTKDDFIQTLSPTPRPTLTPDPNAQYERRGIEERGPLDVVSDYQELSQNPLARALILFDFDSDRVKPESYPTLRNLADALNNELQGIGIAVAGHTDNIGADDYNMDLSKRRAQAVKDFLVSAYNVQVDRLALRWYGYHQPLPFVSNDTEAGRAQNRRVEFIRVQ